MLKELTHAERLEIIEHTKRFAASMKTHRNGRYEFKAKQPNFSSVNFSADIEDVGNEEFSFMNDAQFNFADYNKAAKANFGLAEVKNIVARHNVRDSVRAYALQRNEIIKRNKAKKAEKDKLAKDKFVSHPSY